jgi:hypothetical protein
MSSSIAAAASFASAMLPFWVGVSTARTLVRTMLRDNARMLLLCGEIADPGLVAKRREG